MWCCALIDIQNDHKIGRMCHCNYLFSTNPLPKPIIKLNEVLIYYYYYCTEIVV